LLWQREGEFRGGAEGGVAFFFFIFFFVLLGNGDVVDVWGGCVGRYGDDCLLVY
jgi:hypothetical protein